MYQNSIAMLNENLQSGLGLGAFALKPLGAGTAEFVTADKFIPISFDDDGKPLDAGFLTVKQVGNNDYYTRFERHYFVNGNLTIENKCYHSQSMYDIREPVRADGCRRMVWHKSRSGHIPGDDTDGFWVLPESG